MSTRARARGTAQASVAVVLSGAAARGAFQAGALAELIPALERDGLRPGVWLGTSAGSINATLWGARAHLRARTSAEQVLGIWEGMSDRDVYRPNARAGLDCVVGALLGVGAGPSSLLDTTPLRRAAAENLDVTQLEANVRDGALDAVGVVATRMPPTPGEPASGPAGARSVLFLDEHGRSGYAGDLERALDVVRGPVTAEHVLSSASVPVAFPPVQVSAPAAAAGWYIDGGVRLNAPLHPAVGLGADRIVLVSATATHYADGPLPSDESGRGPDIADGASQVLDAALADRTIEDLRALRRTNRLLAQTAPPRHARLTARSGRPYRPIEVMTVSPPPGELGRLAAQAFERRGLGRLAHVGNRLLERGIRGIGDGVGRRELLSYLLFDPLYFTDSVRLGRAMARAAYAAGWTS
ncbi:MAG TPA: patatin-like phospholipase family protein [Intrasporangium sp.]|uniref:patatin-like phospholipase family protein n=1 Tax=Intrasporangium sp. TaxID=1925024 RepID=UPI002D76E9AE|nr:patatin-like phospholipase family protein [Intrasporangium sp.]HET7397327.1 patatin-like phospholipase family protein [Intrasporangium sp.]